MADTAPKYFKIPDGPDGPPGKDGRAGDPGSRAPWRMYIMGDHPQAIPGGVYSEPDVGHGWLAMGDAYLSTVNGGTVADTVYIGGTGIRINDDTIVLLPEEMTANVTHIDLTAASYLALWGDQITIGSDQPIQIQKKTPFPVEPQRITGVDDPTGATDVVNKRYLEARLVSSLPTRQFTSFMTPLLDPGTSATGTVNLGNGYRLYKISSNAQCRTRLYTTAEKQTADASRPIGTDPAQGTDHGVVLDFVTIPAMLTADLTPVVDGFDGKFTPDGLIPWSVTNTGPQPTIFTITVAYIQTEG